MQVEMLISEILTSLLKLLLVEVLAARRVENHRSEQESLQLAENSLHANITVVMGVA